ncbi:MAG: HAD family phosphatase [Chlamydiia bacterium]|nr:HAD family phosphatase [Chlamydiia bacterium]
MQWIHDYDLFLFDFDGLLVNTEEIHYGAYKRTFEARGYRMKWDFAEYIRIAHYSSEGLKERSYAELEGLFEEEPRWDVIYQEKTTHYLGLLESGAAALMPGVEEFLQLLERWNKKRAVVTHSGRRLIDKLREKNPALSSIEHWITREDYDKPKPDPECYRLAVERLAFAGDRVIGFEDSPRGLTALMGTDALPVIVTEMEYPEIPAFLERGAKHFRNFYELVENFDKD